MWRVWRFIREHTHARHAHQGKRTQTAVQNGASYLHTVEVNSSSLLSPTVKPLVSHYGGPGAFAVLRYGVWHRVAFVLDGCHMQGA